MLSVLLIASCKSKSDKHIDHETKYDTIHSDHKYYCPMHPEVVSDKPGTCPKCGMDLELMTEAVDSLSYLTEPTNQIVISSLIPVAPSFNKGKSHIKAQGYLTYNPNKTKSISARVSGRIEKLYVKFNFERISKGQQLMDIYSPELQIAQDEYLLVYKSSSDAEQSTINALYQKLINLGMTESSIKKIERSGKVNATVPIYSPYEGHIHFLALASEIASHGLEWPSESGSSAMDNSLKEAELLLKKGNYIKKGDLLFTIANEKDIWAMFKIYPNDITLIQKGEKVEVNINNKIYEGKIDFIEKSFDGSNDFYSVRVYLNCTNSNNLTIGTLIEGNITVKSDQAQKLWIPNLSVIHLGKSRSAVFVKQEVGYIAKEVLTGITMNEWTEVLSGISENDSIAPVASYFIDSEAFIKVKQ
ncbi:HlyD family efflux transporter periplasmic adaptor subunit [Sporocytophaga myxococcoides]|uniref:HlyD family efflux transporter periplasmic adaptor subunit n=1 Tax=Sporocytophaga myxococcoides TaxID=153721 RepID=UPI00138ACB17|nr:HlyD family efflux transporter periplasmic adaptor subunit [Sporocytophaga myxococcoides]